MGGGDESENVWWEISVAKRRICAVEQKANFGPEATAREKRTKRDEKQKAIATVRCNTIFISSIFIKT